MSQLHSSVWEHRANFKPSTKALNVISEAVQKHIWSSLKPRDSCLSEINHSSHDHLENPLPSGQAPVCDPLKSPNSRTFQIVAIQEIRLTSRLSKSRICSHHA